MGGLYLNMAAINSRYRLNSLPYTGEVDDIAVEKLIIEQRS